MPTAVTRSRSPRFAAANTASASDLALRIAGAWLVLGCLAVLSIPALRGSSMWLGWLPFWLVLMPAAQCLTLRWRQVLGVSHSTLARLRAQRRGRATRGTRHNRKASQRRPPIWSVALKP